MQQDMAATAATMDAAAMAMPTWCSVDLVFTAQ
jgi:hypothetical protein